MKKILFLIILLLTACSYQANKKNFNNDINFSKNMTLNEFKLNLEKYAKESTYPNLDD